MQDRRGCIYKFVLSIKEIDPCYCMYFGYLCKKKGLCRKPDVIAVDMRFVLPKYFKDEDNPIAHAIVCCFLIEKNLACRNSWGSSFMDIRIPYDADYILG